MFGVCLGSDPSWPSCPQNVRRPPNLIKSINRDTVASVGIILSKSLPFVTTNTAIRVFRQAISLDEVCTVSINSSDGRDTWGHVPAALPTRRLPSPSADPLFTSQHRANFRPNFFHRPVTTSGNKDSKTAQKAAEGETDESFITDEKEVWFVGCHTGAFLILRTCGAHI